MKTRSDPHYTGHPALAIESVVVPQYARTDLEDPPFEISPQHQLLIKAYQKLVAHLGDSAGCLFCYFSRDSWPVKRAVIHCEVGLKLLEEFRDCEKAAGVEKALLEEPEDERIDRLLDNLRFIP